MDTAKVINKLNEIVRHEWTGVVQYTQHSFLVQDLWREVYSERYFREGAEESLCHTRTVGDKIVAPRRHSHRGPQRGSAVHRPAEMLRYDLEFERDAVRLYGEALALCQDDHALRVIAGEHHPRRTARGRKTWRRCCARRNGRQPPRANGKPGWGSPRRSLAATPTRCRRHH